MACDILLKTSHRDYASQLCIEDGSQCGDCCEGVYGKNAQNTMLR